MALQGIGAAGVVRQVACKLNSLAIGMGYFCIGEECTGKSNSTPNSYFNFWIQMRENKRLRDRATVSVRPANNEPMNDWKIERTSNRRIHPKCWGIKRTSHSREQATKSICINERCDPDDDSGSSWLATMGSTASFNWQRMPTLKSSHIC